MKILEINGSPRINEFDKPVTIPTIAPTPNGFAELCEREMNQIASCASIASPTEIISSASMVI